MKWKKVTVGDITTTKKGFAFKSSKYVEKGVPIVRVSNYTADSISDEDLKYYPIEDKPTYIEFELHVKDVIVQTVGSWQHNPDSVVGKVVRVPYFLEGALLNQNAVKLTPIENVDNDYLFYRLKTEEFKGHVLGEARGAANQASITLDTIKSFEFMLPPYEMQKKIGNLLSAYDDLIENNQKQIKLLEEAAQRLYKEWFVNLRFPGHENVKIVDGVPEVWEKTTLDDVIEFNPSISLSKERIKEFVPMSALSTSAMTLDLNEISSSKTNSGSRFQNDDTIMARITPCLENGKIAFVQELQSEEGAVGSTEYIVMRSKSLCPPMVYLLARTHSFRQYAINSMSGSDGRQRVKVERLREYEYLKPDTTLIEKFSGKVTPFFKRIKDLNKTNIVLQEARDRLLPKLMSGEIEV